MNEVIAELYRTRQVTGKSGKIREVHSEIDPEEGRFLYDLVHDDPTVIRTLEVGCAFGMSALHVCEALRDRPGASHTIIDPLQVSYFDSAGVVQLERAGFRFFTLLEEPSELALPRLLEAGPGRFDLVFIDGWHTFDHTMLDSFYATRLLRVGGYLALDDVYWRSVQRATDYLSNYPCYQRFRSLDTAEPTSWKRRAARLALGLFPRARVEAALSRSAWRTIYETTESRMLALRKVAEDERSSTWHNDRF